MIGAIPIIAENRIREAMERGEFDRLDGAGTPLNDADSHYDPDWWLKRKLQREQWTAEDAASTIESLTQVAPPHRRP